MAKGDSKDKFGYGFLADILEIVERFFSLVSYLFGKFFYICFGAVF